MSADTEILAAYQEWALAYDNLAKAETEAENNVAYEKFRDVEAKILSFTPATARGLAVQITVFTSFYEFGLEASNSFNMEAFVAELAAVKRPATFPANEGRAA